MKLKNWIEWTKQMAKIWEKIWTWTYCKFLLLPFKYESQSWRENQMIKEMSPYCDKNPAHNVGGKYRWIPLLSATCVTISYLQKFYLVPCRSNSASVSANFLVSLPAFLAYLHGTMMNCRSLIDCKAWPWHCSVSWVCSSVLSRQVDTTV